jgi:predicted ATPase/DNA-binding SARP family transcriptional activator
VPITLQLQLLGEFRLTAGEQLITTVNTMRIQTLLAYLALHRGAPQSRQQLAYLFWPDSNDSQARTNLRNALFQLRNALPNADDFLQVETQTILWRRDALFQLDVADFEQACDRAQQAATGAVQRAALEQAIQSYGGALLPGCYDDWLLQERERLLQRYLATLEQLIALLESQQDYRTAIDYAQRLLQQDPLRETTYSKLMQLYALTGDRAAALRVYHTCSTTLARELGVDPDPQTRSVYEHLLNLETPPPTGARMRDASPLVGRQQAWDQLQESWRHAVRGHPTFVVVAGEAGIGKTRLVEELVEWAQRQGVAGTTAHCYAVGSALALGVVQEWLRAPFLRRARQELAPLWASEVARLLPELLVERPEVSPPAPLIESWQRQRLFDALMHLLAHNREPLLLVLDDLQWCDHDTIEWVQYLLRSAPQARLMIVSTLRQEAAVLDQPLAAFLHQLGRKGQLVQIDLNRLTSEETAQLVTNLMGQPLDTALAERIFAEAEGNPLFVVEMVRAQLHGEVGHAGRAGEAVHEGKGDGRNGEQSPGHAITQSPRLPPKVLAVIQTRLEALTPAARELAGVAAVIGRAFAVGVLAQASENDEDQLVQGLDELWQQRIIREQAPSGLASEIYDFTHDKLREIAYANLSPMRRRYLHRRVAPALERVFAERLDAVHDQIATHYEAAGQYLYAIDGYARAAEAARRRSSFTEAIGYLQRALGLLPALAVGSEQSQRELRIQTMLGPLLLATKGYAAPEAEQAFARAWELCQQSADLDQRFKVLWGLGRFYLVQPNLARGLAVSQQLLTLAEHSPEAGHLVEAHCAIGSLYLHQAQLPAARTALEAAIAGYDPATYGDHALTYGQDPGVVALAYLAWTLWCQGHPAAALARTAAALELSQTLDHPYSQVIALTYACVQQQFLNEPARCREYAEQAIVLADKYAFSLWLSMATFLRGWSHTQFGDFERGFDDMQRSIDLFRSSGAELGAAYFTALLGETFGRAGQADVGLLLLAQAIDLLARTQDRWCEAELYRLQGELYLRTEQPTEAAAAFQRAIDTAKAQKARQWELRAAVSLGRLRQREGRLAEMLPVLGELVAWFGPADVTPELAAAQTLNNCQL